MAEPDLDLRPERREEIASAISSVLRAAMPGSDVALRGSLATGRADVFSDIDLLWSVPVRHVETAVEAVPDVLSAVAPVTSIRSDPDLLASAERRLLFVRLAGLPLFWRIDLEVQASLAGEELEDAVPTPSAAKAEWSPAASAVANAIAAVKAVLRGQFVEAQGLLDRGFARIGTTCDLREGWRHAVVRLAHAAAGADPEVRELADEVEALAVVLLPQ